MTRDSRYKVLALEQGVTNRRTFRLRTPAGAIIDPVAAGYTSAVLQVRDASLSEGGDLLLNLTTANGGIVLGLYTDDAGAQWSGRLYVSKATAALLTPWGEAVYDLLMTHSSGQVDKAAYGPAVLLPAVSEA